MTLLVLLGILALAIGFVLADGRPDNYDEMTPDRDFHNHRENKSAPKED
jgi:hypothetical protein